MKSIFVLMKGENGEPKKISEKRFAIEDKELERLESDFKQYLLRDQEFTGGVYECSSNENQRKLFLRFDDVLVIC